MLFTLVFLAGAVAAEVPMDSTEHRALIAQTTQQLKADLSWWEKAITTRLGDDVARPQTGIMAMSDPEIGSDRLHAATISAVVVASPADTAGLKPGDRILFIGKRRIEHEPDFVLRELLDGKPGSIVLTVQRSQKQLTYTVHRQPLKCLKAAMDQLDFDVWERQVAILERATDIVADLGANESSDDTTLSELISQLIQIREILTEKLGDMLRTIDETTGKTCVVRQE